MINSGKGRATGYSDFYKGKDRTPGARLTPMEKEKEKDPVAGIPENKDQRRAAIQRRLKRMKASK